MKRKHPVRNAALLFLAAAMLPVSACAINETTVIISKTAFEKGLHGLKLSTTSPEFTSEGSFEKCWIREKE